MADEKKNALVLKGVNDDITEMKSLATLRKRVVSDGEIVSKSENGFRLARGNTGVILRNDGRDFYINGVVALLVEALKEERQARLEDQVLLLKEQEARQELERRLAALERRNGQETGL